MKHSFRNIAIGVLSMTSFVSCQHLPFLGKYQSVSPEGWDSRDTLVFELPVTQNDVIRRMNVTVGIRTISNFKYKKIGLLVTHKNDSNVVLSKDTVMLSVFDDEGKPTSTGFLFHSTTSMINHPITILPYAKEKIEITHLMKMNNLDGIYDVGIELNDIASTPKK